MDFDNSTFRWLISTSEIGPGCTAVLGKKFLFFYVLHCSSISCISVSMISCLVVIFCISHSLIDRKIRESRRNEVAIRFPLYIAIADFIWGTVHLGDHFYLIVEQRYPKDPRAVYLGIHVLYFLGYVVIDCSHIRNIVLKCTKFPHFSTVINKLCTEILLYTCT